MSGSASSVTYCPTALLPYCPTALLPYCPTPLLPTRGEGRRCLQALAAATARLAITATRLAR
ncbi:MAG: hypothetical protein E5X84_22995 [Mesorhizobium sp.]|nr:MAG: hypothetical protein E5X84_22995 [Mesorhizobium sp.]